MLLGGEYRIRLLKYFLDTCVRNNTCVSVVSSCVRNKKLIPFIGRLTMYSDLDNFEVISTIRTGSYGPSKKVRSKRDGKIMVLKEVDYTTMTESEKRVLLLEVNLLRDLCGGCILRHINRIIDRSRPVIHIITEYCEGGDLDKIIVKNRNKGTHIPQQFISKILTQTSLALKACHQWETPVLHRDLKPANVFLDADFNVRLGDFGLARVKTPYYMSPELINNQPYDEKSDIWSLGCLMYELCALVPPFTASNQSELNRKILTGDFPRIPTQYSSFLDKIIMKMIQVEAYKRPDISSIVMNSIQYSMCLIKDWPNILGLFDKYETTLAKEREQELTEKILKRGRKRMALKEKLEEDMLKLAKRPRTCNSEDLSTSDCKVDGAEQGTADMLIKE